MVEVDVQILGGVAVTVFLALIFFGVVVLWDVALALRSVGDKIDKLEDNVDDDLKDIGYALDGISGTQGGGTQLHLSGGGTISPGPGHQESRSHQPAPEGSEVDSRERTATDRQDRTERRRRSAHAGTGHQRRRPSHRRTARSRTESAPSGRHRTDVAEREPAPGSRHSPDETGPAGVESDGPADGNDRSTSTETDDQRSDETESPHPRADRSKGRFITSPDVTPWYATAIDREAIADATSPIAGELESGTVDRSDSTDTTPESDAADGEFDEPIAAGPVDEADEEPIVAGGVVQPEPNDSDAEITTTEDDGDVPPTDDEGDAPSADDRETQSADDGEDAPSTDDGEDTQSTDGAGETDSSSLDVTDSTDGSATTGGEQALADEESTDVLDDVTLEQLREVDSSATNETDDVDELLAVLLAEFGRDALVERLLDGPSDPSSGTDFEPDDGESPTGSDSESSESGNPPETDREMADSSMPEERTDDNVEEPVPDDADEVAAEKGDKSAAADSEDDGEADDQDGAQSDGDETDANGADDAETDGEEGSDAQADEAADSAKETDEAADSEVETDVDRPDGTEFTFEELTDDRAPEPELTVDEAVETVNDEEPALSRSGHGVDASAEADEESATLVYEFDPETVEATESTARLLRYQLRSFADSADGSDVGVTVDGNRIVVDIPDADGESVSQWQHAVVETIDRTLFLSDNSN